MKGRTLLSTALVIVLLLAFAFQPAFAQEQEEDSPFLGFDFEAFKPGVRITEIPTTSPTWLFGLQVGDVITAVDEKLVTASTFEDAVETYAQDDQLTFTVLRDGDEMEISLPLNGIAALSEITSGEWLQRLEQIPFYQRFMNAFNPQDSADRVDFAAASVNGSGESALSRILDFFSDWLYRVLRTKSIGTEAKMMPPAP